jgi:MoaA/NifB/PqqE/SkfB family radical SAM enzyme
MTPKDMLTNPHFCPMPWTGIMYNFDGSVKNCIRSDFAKPIGNIKNNTIEEIVTGAENIARQQQIVDQQPVPSCHTCKDLERGKPGFDIISDRIFYIKELKQVPPATYQLGNFDLNTVDVRWSNLCNFSCVYCVPKFSSRWAEELKVTIEQPSDEQKQQFRDYIYKNAKQLKHVYLAGGEPLLMKENLELLSRLNPDVSLRINTNLSKTDTKIFETVCKFKTVHWTVSAESQNQEYEYIRHGGVWSDFLSNLDIIKQSGHKISFNMLWFLLNYNSVFDFVKAMQDRGFHNNSFIIGAMISPLHLNIRHLPQHVLHSLSEKLKRCIAEKPGHLLEDSYQNMLHYIQQPFEKNLKNSFAELSKLDQRRGLDSKEIFKELYNLKED